MNFVILSDIDEIETIAASKAIRDRRSLERTYGKVRWRKMKGTASIRLSNDEVRLVELDWYEAHGIGRKEIKRKRYLD